MESGWFQEYVRRFHQRQSLPAVEAWVSAHEQLPPPDAAAKSADKPAEQRAVAARGQFSARNDARTTAGGEGRGVDFHFPPGGSSINDYNIFADLALHDQAAATIASASQRKSGFSASMPENDGVALERFKAYLNDFVAPHWLMTYFREQEVHHTASNHAQFVENLMSIVVEGLRAAGGNENSATKAAENVRNLAKRLSSKSSTEERLTLFSSFWMQRDNSTDPVLYGIFYTTLTARYTQNGKANVISTRTWTYSAIFNLISGVLMANEAAYNRLLKASVDDWLDGHDV